MTMKFLIIFGVFLGLLLGGLIFATIRSADALHVERFGSNEAEDASTEAHSMTDRRLDEYIRFLQNKRFHHSRPSDEARKYTRKLLQEISKRTAYAITLEEFQQIQSLENNEKTYGGGIGLMRKRNQQKEYHSGGCEAKIDWIFLNQNHFPRFVRSYNCTTTGCGIAGSCSQKRYPVYVLRMNSPDNIPVLDEGCDTHLPEELRCDWKLVPINVTTYCECVSNGINSLTYG